MKKFLLFIVVIVALIILIARLDWTLLEWSYVFAGLLVLRVIVLAIKSPDYGEIGNKVMRGVQSFTGYQSSWWEDREYVVVEDYTSGSIWSLIYKWGVTVAGALSVVYLIFKGIVWIVSQPIFWIVVGSLAGIALIVFICIRLSKKESARKEAEREQAAMELKKKCDSLVSDFVNIANIPMPEGAITEDNIAYCENAFSEIKSLSDNLTSSDDLNIATLKRQITDKKLEVFYAVSLRAQALDLIQSDPSLEEELFDPIREAIKNHNYNKLRNSSNNVEEDYAEFNQFLDEQKSLLEDNTMSPYLDELDKYKDMDTSALGGLITSSSKLAEKANILKEIFQAAQSEYEELAEVRDKINYILDLMRISSFESIYLGVELINYVRENAGGKSLEKASDLVEMDVDLESMDLSGAGQDSDVMGLAVTSVSSLFDRFANDKNFTSYALENPKETLGNEALAFIGNAIRERNEAISSNNEAIEQIITKLPELVDAYTSGQAQLLRAIEIIKALIKANGGFDKIYAPLYQKVFVNNEISSVSIKDMQLLAGALKEYNKIAKSEI